MYRSLFCFSGIKSPGVILSLVVISFLTIGGCSENNGGGGVDDPAPGPQTSCTGFADPCVGIVENEDGRTIQCTALDGRFCAVDLEVVMKQANPDGTKITGDTVMWIEAWGGSGGSSRSGTGGTGGASGGYAVTTTSVNDIKAKNGGSGTIYYFYGTPGLEPPARCGAGGGVATIVTTEDLAMNPASNPTQTAPPILLVAGGGGGGAAGNQVGLCLTRSGVFPGNGGEAFATIEADGQGAGSNSTAGVGGTQFFAIGGNANGTGNGGASFGTSPDADPTSGSDGFGGLGGIGGEGPGCVGFGANNFSNSPVQLSITAGLGGNGGSARGSCAAGGGGGGGGYGGGGGGEAGNEVAGIVAGAGGGSFAIQSTQFSRLAPTTRQDSPCVNSASNGCVRITFAP